MDLLRSIFKGDKVVWLLFLALCVISVVEVFSASSTLTYKSGDHWGPITQHCFLLMAGVVIVLVVHNIPYKYFRTANNLLLPLSVVLLAIVALLGYSGDRVNGAARWMEFAGVQFQPSELAKMAVIIFTASQLARGQDENGARPAAFKWICIVSVIMAALIVPENFSTGALLLLAVYVMMIIGRVQASKLLILGGGVAAVVFVFVAFLLITPNSTLSQIPGGHRFTTVKERITGFASNEEVPAAKFDIDENAQVAHARIAIASSNVFGKGPGNSVERDFLSQAFSDFIFAIIIEELGLVGGFFVVFLYVCLLIRVGKIARKCDRTFPAFLVIGIGLLLVIQAMFNMMVAVGLAPVTGQPLPLISKGGTSTWINCAYIGIILSVSRYTVKLEEEKRAQQEAEAQTMPLLEAGDQEHNEMKTVEEMTSDEMSVNNDTEME